MARDTLHVHRYSSRHFKLAIPADFWVALSRQVSQISPNPQILEQIVDATTKGTQFQSPDLAVAQKPMSVSAASLTCMLPSASPRCTLRSSQAGIWAAYRVPNM